MRKFLFLYRRICPTDDQRKRRNIFRRGRPFRQTHYPDTFLYRRQPESADVPLPCAISRSHGRRRIRNNPGEGASVL